MEQERLHAWTDTKATDDGLRDSLDLHSTVRTRVMASAGGTAWLLSTDRPDTMYGSKSVIQHVSKQNVY